MQSLFWISKMDLVISETADEGKGWESGGEWIWRNVTSLLFLNKTKWLFVTLTQATGGHYIEVCSEGEKLGRRYLCL